MGKDPEIPREPRDDEEVVYTAYITRNGKRIYPKGAKVFRLIVKKNRKRRK